MKKYFIALSLALALVASPAVAGAQALSIDQLLSLISTLQAQIAALTNQLNQLQGGSSSGSGGGVSSSISGSTGSGCVVITRPLYRGISDNESGGEVTRLQSFLRAQGVYNDDITGFYGPATEAGVKRFQAQNNIVSSGDGASTGYGLVGSLTRTRIRVIGCAPPNPTPTPVPPLPTPIPDPTQPSITILSPNGGETYKTGDIVSIKWSPGSLPSSNNVRIGLRYWHNDPTYAAGQLFDDWIIEKTPNTGYYSWKIPEYYATGVDPLRFSVYVLDLTSNISDSSDRPFTILAGESNQTLSVNSPIAGSQFSSGQKILISWYPDINDSTGFQLLRKNDPKFTRLFSADYYSASVNSWVVPADLPPGNDYYIKVTQGLYRSRTGYSGVFSIVNDLKPSITVTTPNGGESWDLNQQHLIHWTSSNVRNANVYLNFEDGGACFLGSVPASIGVKYFPEVIGNVRCPNINKSITAGNYTVLIYGDDEGTKDRSDRSFTITNASSPASSITILSPNGGESYDIGQQVSVKWKTVGLPQNADTLLAILDDRIPGWQTRSFFGSAPPLDYAKLVSSNGYENVYEYKFTVPSNFNSSLPSQYQNIFGGNHYKMNVVAVSNPYGVTLDQLTIKDYSDNPFALAGNSVPPPTPTITVVSPNGGEKYTRGATYNTGDMLDYRVEIKNIHSKGDTTVSMRSVDGSYNKQIVKGIGWDPAVVNPIIDIGGMQINNTIPVGNYYLVGQWSGYDGVNIMDQSNSSFTVSDPTYSLKASLSVTVLNGGIQCFTTPCEFPLNNATVMLYADINSKPLATKVAVNGVATFTDLSPGTYYAVASYSGYGSSGYIKAGLVSGQNGSLKIPIYPSSASTYVPKSSTDSQLAAVLQSLQSVLNSLSTGL